MRARSRPGRTAAPPGRQTVPPGSPARGPAGPARNCGRRIPRGRSSPRGSSASAPSSSDSALCARPCSIRPALLPVLNLCLEFYNSTFPCAIA